MSLDVLFNTFSLDGPFKGVFALAVLIFVPPPRGLCAVDLVGPGLDFCVLTAAALP